jgi:small subunit ribosomal protein S18
VAPRAPRRAPKDTGRRQKKKICIFCKDKIDWVDYKDVNTLRRFMSDRGKIRARRVSGNCVQHQRDVAIAIKTARELALLPYTQRTVTERTGGRGGPRGDRGDRSGGMPPSGRPVGAPADVNMTEGDEAVDEALEAAGDDPITAAAGPAEDALDGDE